MDDYQLFMDVSGDVDKTYVAQGKVTLLPMDFIVDGELYRYTDDERGFDAKEFYDWIKIGKECKTSQINPATYEEYFEPYLKAGRSALYICLSSGLSSSYSSALKASQALNERYDNAKLVVVDSLRATGAMGVLCERMIANKQKGLSIDDNAKDLENYRLGAWACCYVDELTSLHRGGRISKSVAIVGGLLNIKPLITFTDDGKLTMWGKQRGVKPSIKKLIEYYCDNADMSEESVVYLCHADEDTNSDDVIDKLKSVNPSCVIKKRLLSPIIGAHLGPGAMVLCFAKKMN
ncbi:MAG: DegV family protein [Christensenellales bacterium]